MKKLFGTDGIRGIANEAPMTPETILKVGRAAANRLSDSRKRCKIIIGKDTRISGYMIETALSAGICSMGVDVMLVGPLPTPGVAYLTHSMRLDAGVVISASHNEYQDNGIKFFSRDGLKLPDKVESEIEEMVFSENIEKLRPIAGDIGRAHRIDDAGGRYVVFAKSTFPNDLTLEGMKVVVDCANGAAYRVAPLVFDELRADVLAINDEPDGKNINLDCGALHTKRMREMVVAENADMGVALDGDGDRCILCDSKGNVVDGDKIMAISAKFLKSRGELYDNRVVGTVMSNYGFEKHLKESGINLLRTQVGDRYVAQEMLTGGFSIGGEQSGHIIFRKHGFTGDGIVTALQIMSVMKSIDRPLSELIKGIEDVPQVLINLKVRKKKSINDLHDVKRAINDAQSKLKDSGRVLVRYSGTEMIARVMVEGENDKTVRDCANNIAESIKAAIGEE